MDLEDLKAPENAPEDLASEMRSCLVDLRRKMMGKHEWIRRCAVAALYWRKAHDDAESFSLEAEEADEQANLWQEAAFWEGER